MFVERPSDNGPVKQAMHISLRLPALSSAPSERKASESASIWRHISSTEQRWPINWSQVEVSTP